MGIVLWVDVELQIQSGSASKLHVIDREMIHNFTGQEQSLTQLRISYYLLAQWTATGLYVR